MDVHFDNFFLLESGGIKDSLEVLEGKLGLGANGLWGWTALWIDGDTARCKEHIASNTGLDIVSNGFWSIWGGDDAAHDM